jgi:hypothetical protein
MGDLRGAGCDYGLDRVRNSVALRALRNHYPARKSSSPSAQRDSNNGRVWRFWEVVDGRSWSGIAGNAGLTFSLFPEGRRVCLR